MSSENTMCLCIRRLNQAYFVKCTPNDTVGYLKQQVSLATKKEILPEHMRIINAKDRQPLDDDDEKLSKYEELKNDAELYVVFQISDGEWEAVHVHDTEAATTGGGDAAVAVP
ncbi:hypothetical protein IV203_019827 [Nitzschia inconspicua]|uniref:Ubiquitin-like domain-containing protein n=1 Tax=Nitzschia inconspicua TaxID=303405 RepID=A0A9K3LZX2_9STRA|nr:hypothetical protein IV203_020396 [Nitzschia inconspicua]KAG7371257.1 hypothetical protein IV203_019827 [Nitzschia inconspicua]